MLVSLVVVAALIGIVFYFVRSKSKYVRYIPWARWVVDLLKITFDYWKFNRKYSDLADVAVRALILSELANSDSDLRDLRKDVGVVVSDILNVAYPTNRLTNHEKNIIISAYVAAISYDNLRATVYALTTNPKELDVVKATLLVVDIMGEMVNLEDKLGQQYFQHLVFGINKTLKLVKDDTRSSNKKAVSTLFRVYKITKAYNHRRDLNGKTREQIYTGLVNSFGGTLNVVSE